MSVVTLPYLFAGFGRCRGNRNDNAAGSAPQRLNFGFSWCSRRQAIVHQKSGGRGPSSVGRPLR